MSAATRNFDSLGRRAAVAAVPAGGPMSALAGERLLEAWDRGTAAPHLERALVLLEAGRPDAAPESLARLGIPARNRELLRLRWVTFGPVLIGFTACASCGARLEFSASIPPMLDRLEGVDPGDAVAWEDGGAAYTLRAVTTDDLRDAVRAADDADARRLLLDRCVSCVSVGGVADAAEALAVVREDPLTAARFDRLHEGAEVLCEVICPQCASADVVDLDIASFLWDEVRHAALRLLREVHDLASAYGWSEAAIAAMSGPRRRAYLELVRA